MIKDYSGPKMKSGSIYQWIFKQESFANLRIQEL